MRALGGGQLHHLTTPRKRRPSEKRVSLRKPDTIKDIPEGEWTKSTIAGQKYINVDKPLKLIEEDEVVMEPAIYGSNGIIIVPSFQKKTGIKIYSVDWEFEEPKDVKTDTADNRPVRAPVAQATKH